MLKWYNLRNHFNFNFNLNLNLNPNPNPNPKTLTLTLTVSRPACRGFLNCLETELDSLSLAFPVNLLPLSAFEVHLTLRVAISRHTRRRRERLDRMQDRHMKDNKGEIIDNKILTMSLSDASI